MAAATERPNRRPYVVLVVVVVAALAAVLAVAMAGRGTSSGSPRSTAGNSTAVAPSTTEVTSSPVSGGGLDPAELAAGEVLLEPLGFALTDGFSGSAALGTEAAPKVPLPVLSLPTTSVPLPADQVALAQVAGAEPGLYGGTRDVAACDKEGLTAFLETNLDKGAAWAAVHGIAPTVIRDFISRLTPVVLTRDTRVTNHGFRNGRAYPHPSVLQAGHAVLVDEFGVPRAKCSCGNPLLPPTPMASAPSYVGPGWSSFSTTTIVVVIATVAVTTGFVIVDLDTGALVERPIGFGPGFADTPIAADALCDLFPADPSCASVADTVAEPVAEPPTDPVELVNVGNIGGVGPGATAAPGFTVAAPALIAYIQTYHYGSGSAPGQLGLQSADGSFYGPFQAAGLEGQGGVANAYWVVEPNAVVPAGTYTIWDSEPSTWSTNAEAGMVGFGIVRGVVGVELPLATPGVLPETAPTADDAALTIIDMLLLDCGYDIADWIDGGPVGDGWKWAAVIDGVERTFVVTDPLGDFAVQVGDQPSADIAVACGFYQP